MSKSDRLKAILDEGYDNVPFNVEEVTSLKELMKSKSGRKFLTKNLEHLLSRFITTVELSWESIEGLYSELDVCTMDHWVLRDSEVEN